MSADQFAVLQKSSGFYAISAKSIGEQRQAAAREERDNDRIIALFEHAHPHTAPLIQLPARGSRAGLNPNDTYTHTIELRDGRKLRVELLGPRSIKSSVRHAIEAFPSRDNQLSLYQVFYAGLNAGSRSTLQLPEPEAVKADTGHYTSQVIQSLNDRISTQLAQPQALPEADAGSSQFTESLAPKCTAEEGVGNLSDASGNSPACGADANGIYAHYNWPSKSSLTCVKDQATRGTCVAFATASAMESMISKQEGRFVNLSEQFIYQQGKIVSRNDFDDGLAEATVLSTMADQKWKIPFETAWEYNPSLKRQTNTSSRLYTQSCDDYTGNCSDSSHQMPVYCNDNGKYRYCGFVAEQQPAQGYGISSSSQLWDTLDHSASITRMKAVLSLGKPVIWALDVVPSWDAATDAGFVTYKAGETSRGGHAVHVVGYIDNAALATLLPSAPAGSGGGYMIVKNSWTNCWSDGGFVYVPYDYLNTYSHGALAIAL